ncbi:MAG: SPOR domain-containing protein [Bacteroidota bacterium]|nr:SPOR domain-containing protein [Bacteroidota bacterium]
MEDKKFEIEGDIEENDELTEEFEEDDEEYVSRGRGIYILLAVFILLFLASLSLFAYFQLYQGDGNWDFSFKKKSSGNVAVNKGLQEENIMLYSQVDSLNNVIANMENAQIATSETPESSETVEETSSPKPKTTGSSELFHQDLAGEKYEVQIGAFRSFNFSKYNNNLVNMNVDVKNGLNQLVIGRFSTFKDACVFAKDMKSIGIQNAFVVKKVDGKRVKFSKYCN